MTERLLAKASPRLHALSSEPHITCSALIKVQCIIRGQVSVLVTVLLEQSDGLLALIHEKIFQARVLNVVHDG